MKSFLIIGMGNFGHHLCRELSKQRCEVMAVDAVAEAVEDVLSLVVSAKVGDCTNEEVLRSFGIPDFDAWVLSGRKLDDEQLDRLKSVIAEYAASFE